MKTMLKIITATVLLMSAATTWAAENFSISTISEHIYLLKGPEANTLVAADTDGLILFDGVPAQYAREYLGFVREETGVDNIKTLVLSHWHPEVTGLNSILGPQGVEIIAHENTRQWLGTTIRERGETIVHTPMAAEQLPNRTFYWGELSVPFRDDTIEIAYLLQSHTDGDIYAYIKDANVLYTGPAILADSWATVDETTNGFIGGLTDAYDTLGNLIDENTIIVPASGKLLNKTEFDDQDALYESLKAEMVTLLRQSRSAEEVVIANPALGLKPEWGDPSEFLDEGFRSFYGHLRNGRQIGGGFP
ncbi:MAG: glyoxylase-like metal-dependent hydrolase (beta-lactamase superfamily II) [Pseudohongiellaceae bacterium]|jgi:glyoxylase-like metal-dependent hydrolase (beta-lactamase superfamily II)